MSSPALALFDIDGTLLDSAGAGGRSFRLALKSGFDIQDELKDIGFAGRTDLAIVGDIFHRHSIDLSDKNFQLFEHEYVAHLREELKNGGGRVYPGIKEVLQELLSHRDCHVALLTGNYERGAWLKLERYGLRDYFEIGAFGSDHEERSELAALALSRAGEKFGIDFEKSKVCVIGDTPLDIECARHIGVKVVSVATGIFSLEELAPHSPDALFADFSNPQELVDCIVIE